MDNNSVFLPTTEVYSLFAGYEMDHSGKSIKYIDRIYTLLVPWKAEHKIHGNINLWCIRRGRDAYSPVLFKLPLLFHSCNISEQKDSCHFPLEANNRFLY